MNGLQTIRNGTKRKSTPRKKKPVEVCINYEDNTFHIFRQWKNTFSATFGGKRYGTKKKKEKSKIDNHMKYDY